MIPRGEVGIIVAQFGLSAGVLNADLFAVVLFMAVASTILAPPVLVRLYAGAKGAPPAEEFEAAEVR